MCTTHYGKITNKILPALVQINVATKERERNFSRRRRNIFWLKKKKRQRERQRTERHLPLRPYGLASQLDDDHMEV
ncbi:hypothetical protein TNCV_1019971 [Trichonephila clavipes]|nr:hypothetical protein TNCV_1019971 [Trichonephila clavipes]